MKNVEIGEIRNLSELERSLSRVKNLEGITIPSFVMSSEKSILKIFSMFGITS